MYDDLVTNLETFIQDNATRVDEPDIMADVKDAQGLLLALKQRYSLFLDGNTPDFSNNNFNDFSVEGLSYDDSVVKSDDDAITEEELKDIFGADNSDIYGALDFSGGVLKPELNKNTYKKYKRKKNSKRKPHVNKHKH